MLELGFNEERKGDLTIAKRRKTLEKREKVICNNIIEKLRLANRANKFLVGEKTQTAIERQSCEDGRTKNIQQLPRNYRK